jgi:predicted MPP superfamily phosphohydrolase
MAPFLSAAFLMYGAMHVYAFSKVWIAFPNSMGIGLSMALWCGVMTASPLIVWRMAKQRWHNVTVIGSWVTYTWMGFLLLFCSIALLFDFSHALSTLLGLKWHLNDSVAFRTIALLALGMFGYGFIEARHIRVEKINIITHKLSPAIGRVAIVQISDLHLGVMLGHEFLGRVIARLHEIHPDIIVATGDLVDGQWDNLNGLAKHFLSCRPPHGSFAVLGNHEYFAGLENSLRFLHRARFTVLRGRAVATGGITLVGIDDPSVGMLGQKGTMNTKSGLPSVPPGDFIVLLKHQPIVDSEIPFDLQLSGHIHGGQIFPFGLLTRLTYGVRTGLTQLANGRWLYVSRGVGTWGPPIRVFAAPEITLITIESENK